MVIFRYIYRETKLTETLTGDFIMSKYKAILIHIDESSDEALRQISFDDRRSKSEIIRELINSYLAKRVM
jgi:hypothetical protein